MRDNEYEKSIEFTPDTDPVKTKKSTEFVANAPEHHISTEHTGSEYEFDLETKKGEDSSPAALRESEGERKKRGRSSRSKYKKNLLLQAAAVATAIVVIESSAGVDVLGQDQNLSENVLTEALEDAGAQKGVITVSMLWETTDDIDLHVVTPSGSEIYYSNRRAGGGELDVDMQTSSYVGNFAEHPVENVYFETAEKGEYKVFIVNFTDRNEGTAQVLVRVKVRGRTKTYRVKLEDGEYQKEICTFTY